MAGRGRMPPGTQRTSRGATVASVKDRSTRELGREHVAEIQRARLLAAMIDVCAERGVADVTVAHSASSPKQVLKLYERWLKTGSDTLAQALGAHGFTPSRGTGRGKGVLQ